MGLLIDGQWHDVWYDTKSTGGRFERKASVFRNWISADGTTAYPAELGRYHLYLSLACPWAHRTLIFRTLKNLQDAISISIVDPLMLDEGWVFSDYPGTLPDTINHATALHQVYCKSDPTYSGRVTVPVLWDKQTATIVNNESADIIRILNGAFRHLVPGPDVDYYPERLRPEIDRINDIVYPGFNNGVYRCGFATTQTAYDEAFERLFETIDTLEALLADRPYLAGAVLTEADWRFYTTALRFEPVYYSHFKCNKRHLPDYPKLWSLVKQLTELPGIRDTINFDHIKRHYYGSHRTINPTGIIPRGPDMRELLS
ncbi:MAG: glutathione S-transferase family protein [Verrucomicrobia bacterium]|nr:glutathione S-transferase family protein [Verrucomicrobiota bacterium]